MNIPTIDLAQTGANIVTLRKAAGLTVAAFFTVHTRSVAMERFVFQSLKHTQSQSMNHSRNATPSQQNVTIRILRLRS